MRMSRIKASKGEDALYHCMSRSVGGDYIFGYKEKDTFLRMMWRLADFMGIAILDYVLMSNHYHQLLEVPGIIELSDNELIERVATYYGPKNPKVTDLKNALIKGGGLAQDRRSLYLGRMGDISEYQKILKQGFTRWYNKQNKRRGTLWMERFKSVLVEDNHFHRQVVSTYIELNPVRANMVEDPKDYPHCAYAAALAGDLRCRNGIMRVMGIDHWDEAAPAYRTLLMQRGCTKAQGKPGSVSRELLLKTLQAGGKLSIADLVHLRLRHLTDGLVLGSEQFVQEAFDRYRSHFGKKRISGARSIRGLASGDLHVIRDLRTDAIS